MSQFEIYFTTPQHILWSDDATPVMLPDNDRPAIKLGRAWQFNDADLDAPWGANPREFNFSVPIYDPVFDEVKAVKPTGVEAYNTFVYVEWRGHPAFWGPILTPEWKLKDRTVNFRCYSQLKRWEFHYLRDGDIAIAPSNTWGGLAPLDYRGIRLLRDAAEITPPQLYPPLGIRNGSNTDTADDTKTIKFERGQQVLRAAGDLLANSFGCEMVEVPLGFGEAPPYYAEIQTATSLGLGTNRYDQIIFQGGYGTRNVDDVIYTPGGKIITHANALDRGGKHRETRVDVDSALENGVWVDWNAVDYAVTDANANAILGDGVAQTLIDYYGRPPKFADLVLKKDDEVASENQFFWMEDFFHGDFIRASVKAGGMSLPDAPYRIIGAGLHQEDAETGVRQRISIVPDVVGAYAGDDE